MPQFSTYSGDKVLPLFHLN